MKQTNAYAMQYGLYLGLWGIMSLCLSGMALRTPALSTFSSIAFIGSPFFAAILTTRFRRNVTTPAEGFSFGWAFFFTIAMGVYASFWIAAFVFLYLTYWDGGYLFSAYGQMLMNPDTIAQLKQSGMMETLGGESALKDMVATLQKIPPASYSGVVIYSAFVFGPVISVVISLICRRSPMLRNNA